MSRVLVTGGSGYVGTQLIAALLRDGRSVRATVRSLADEGDMRAAVRRGDADDSGLEFVAAEPTADARTGAAATDHSQRPGPRRARLAPTCGRDNDRRDRREPGHR